MINHPRLESLLKKITQIELKIQQEQARPYSNPLFIQELKREKLKIRDEINVMMDESSQAA